MRGSAIMKVVLVQCPCSFGCEMPPLGLAYLASYLKKYNYDVSILDLSILLYERVAKEDKKYWLSSMGYSWYLTEVYKNLPFLSELLYDEFVSLILSLDSDLLGFSIQNTSALFTLEVIKRIKAKEPSKKIILGGPNCYNISADNDCFRLHHDLQNFSDIIVIGEGESILLNVVRNLENKLPLDECKGIVVKKKEKWHFTGYAQPIIDIDNFPFPDFSLFNINAYTDKSALPILTSRGCVMKCVFCTDTHFWMPYRYRSSNNVIMEMEENLEKYKNHSFSFNDSLINGSYSALLNTCNLIIKKNISIHWGGNFRIDKRVDLIMLKKMKTAGCEYINIGIESASNRVLKLMRKGFTIEDVENFINTCNKAGIRIIANWIIGFPGEEDEDFMATVEFIKRNNNLISRNTFSVLAINQFSYLERHKEEFGVILNGDHLGLWYSSDGKNTIEVRSSRLKCVENMESQRFKEYSIVRQTT